MTTKRITQHFANLTIKRLSLVHCLVTVSYVVFSPSASWSREELDCTQPVKTPHEDNSADYEIETTYTYEEEGENKDINNVIFILARNHPGKPLKPILDAYETATKIIRRNGKIQRKDCQEIEPAFLSARIGRSDEVESNRHILDDLRAADKKHDFKRIGVELAQIEVKNYEKERITSDQLDQVIKTCPDIAKTAKDLYLITPGVGHSFKREKPDVILEGLVRLDIRKVEVKLREEVKGFDESRISPAALALYDQFFSDHSRGISKEGDMRKIIETETSSEVKRTLEFYLPKMRKWLELGPPRNNFMAVQAIKGNGNIAIINGYGHYLGMSDSFERACKGGLDAIDQ
ncbi:MAG: hypothetical protein C5B49_15185 [Bdellovibrio sp.]|nr:MAG: hypothetical protein C5B49_15185 [Bdellovibrio sp.]